MGSPRTPSSDDEISQSDLETAVRVLRVLGSRHWKMVSSTGAAHITSTSIILNTIGPLIARPDPVARPSDRVGGLCPCELSDLVKKR